MDFMMEFRSTSITLTSSRFPPSPRTSCWWVVLDSPGEPYLPFQCLSAAPFPLWTWTAVDKPGVLEHYRHLLVASEVHCSGSDPVMSSLGFFTRAKEEDRRWTEGEKAKEERGGAPLTGAEARDFYQSLFGEETPNGQRQRKEDRKERRRRAGRSRGGGPQRRQAGGSAVPPSGQMDTVSERDGHRLLRCAQEGDLRALTELLDRGCDVNFRDGFYWTPLMCASHAGQGEAVRLLLERGAAWVGVVDTQGRDARSLALQAGYQDVVRELEQFGFTDTSGAPAAVSASCVLKVWVGCSVCTGTGEGVGWVFSLYWDWVFVFLAGVSPRWCEVCAVNYTDSDDAHAASTLHQFSLKRPPAAPHYCLPESSVSYRMMLRSGWDPQHGLGPSHTGRKNPVGTVLKRDLRGLGYGPPQRSKVTHFSAKDPQAVQRTRRKEAAERRERGTSLTVKEMKRREERQRSWERDFRTSFHIHT
ncbi:hypothetical protein NFI96_027845 [Prochilodus magdalenae]|nr:hypothetical protein NFI96_027845 [Prochilodus magdalenae]